MGSDDLFHPNHIVPPTKLIAALMKFAHFYKAKVLVKIRTVGSQIRIIPYGIANAGV